MADTEHEKHHRTTAQLLSDAMGHINGLFRKEIDLVRAEVNESLNHAGVAVGLLVAAVVVVLTGLDVVSAAIVAGLVELGLEPGWAALIVGVVYFFIAYLMARKGLNELREISIAPKRVADNVRKDAEAIRGTENAR
ncbi:phage holin family protein [Tranquillimonas alkanivorans]|uniref:Putative Holin-X, holin superfamily III n=1 Tax=Tranquillimonas alkanivorans TaxID=441119 RepID=A0A1I5PIY4_9RHOB|nr:phage holin family protein [Tranquillimonas alkanivorans]SFP34005.1 Putative Holin-X, holin superfamily III [Tranquillimonas alkanivorans]